MEERGRLPDAGAAGHDPRFTERLWPSVPTWLVAPGLGAGAGLTLVPLGTSLALTVAVLVAVAVAAGLVAASPRIEVRDGLLRAGKARVPVTLLGDAAAARGEDARQERGPRLDARAYLCIRGWVDPVVRVHLEDPADPTPYWLLSTRHPEALVRVLQEATPDRDRPGGRRTT